MNSLQSLTLAPFPNIPVSLIATDMDGTLTRSERFDTNLLRALERLAAAAIPVVVVTGRSAGWVSGIAHYLPVAGAIAENGGVFFQAGQAEYLMQYLVEVGDILQYRSKLAAMFGVLRDRFPQIRESADNAFRQTDWTFEVTGLSTVALTEMAQICGAAGWSFTYSTVQCHIMSIEQNKAAGLKRVLGRSFPGVDFDRIVTVGDSPNDESLFGFEQSVGVANVRRYVTQLTQLPTYVTQAEEGAGFCELVDRVLARS
jgi:HAD superfamily hydrolase (TIGR01484 family)